MDIVDYKALKLYNSLWREDPIHPHVLKIRQHVPCLLSPHFIKYRMLYLVRL